MAAPPEKNRVLVSAPLRSLAQVCRRLGLSPTTVTALVDSGELPAADMSARAQRGKRHKRILRFRDEDVDRLEEKRFRASQASALRPSDRRN